LDDGRLPGQLALPGAGLAWTATTLVWPDLGCCARLHTPE